MTAFLSSWVRTLDQEDDALSLLLDTRPGQSLTQWEHHAHENLLQSSRACRTSTLRIVRECLLDLRDGLIQPSTWLRLFHEGNPLRRRNLLYGRLHAHQPWILRAVDQLVLPRLRSVDEPLAPHDADLVTPDAWDAFLATNLLPKTGIPSTKKTRSIVRQNLANLGILTISNDMSRQTRVRHSEPDPMAFGWLLAFELTSSARSEAPESWAIAESIPARIFATRPAYATYCVEAAVGAGLLTRGFLAGSSRLHPVPEAL